MKQKVCLAGLSLCAASPAFALFSLAEQPIPEPAGYAMIAAGALTIAGLRYLRKRRR